MKANDRDRGHSVAAMKLKWIADYLHHPIAISDLEKKVISTEIFNRLHNILQNSSVFFTYPSDRISRFSHSLGTMHIAGEIFRYSVFNAEEDARERLLSDLTSDIDEILRSDVFRAEAHHLFGKAEDTKRLKRFACDELSDPLYHLSIPSVIVEEPQRYTFLVAFQAIRLVGLLHDLGSNRLPVVIEVFIAGFPAFEPLEVDGGHALVDAAVGLLQTSGVHVNADYKSVVHSFITITWLALAFAFRWPPFLRPAPDAVHS